MKLYDLLDRMPIDQRILVTSDTPEDREGAIYLGSNSQIEEIVEECPEVRGMLNFHVISIAPALVEIDGKQTLEMQIIVE